MYVLNKVVWFFLNPLTLSLVAACAGAVMLARRRRGGGLLLGASLAALWFMSTPACLLLVGAPLEKPWLSMQKADSLPKADAIVLLGGGISKFRELEYPDMNDAADRLWHVARLWKAGKAPLVVVSGSNDLAAAVPLLVDLGVPREAIAVDDKSRNTHENSRFTERLILERAASDPELAARRPSVLLVTSAWHMARALGNFSKTSLFAVPAPCDFTSTNFLESGLGWWHWLAPSSDAAVRVGYAAKEWVGRLAKK